MYGCANLAANDTERLVEQDFSPNLYVVLIYTLRVLTRNPASVLTSRVQLRGRPWLDYVALAAVVLGATVMFLLAGAAFDAFASTAALQGTASDVDASQIVLRFLLAFVAAVLGLTHFYRGEALFMRIGAVLFAPVGAAVILGMLTQ